MQFDLLVIGAGSGGVRAARMAAESGAKVAIVEDGMMGGTCVNLGCIPKKFYVNAGIFPHYRLVAEDYGWSASEARFSLDRLRQAKNTEIARLQSVYRSGLQKSGVVIFDGRATVMAANRVVTGDRELSAQKILIATGTTPAMPGDLPGVAHASNSDAVFALSQLPARVLVYGGSYIAVELAGVLARLGSKVHLVYRGERLLKNFDADLVNTLHTMLVHDGITVQLNTTVKSLHNTNREITAITSCGEIVSDFVLFALGRKANLAGLGVTLTTATPESPLALADTGRGFIKVDDNYQTSTPGIFALGDIIGTAQLTPMAIAQAMDFAARHYGSAAPSMPTRVPTTVFTHPPLGSVGIQEHQLQQQGRPYRRYSGKFTPLHLSLGTHPEQVHFKILVEDATDLVVGVHIFGEYAGEIIQCIAAAMEAAITKAQLDTTLAVHPVIAEELVTSYQPDLVWRG